MTLAKSAKAIEKWIHASDTKEDLSLCNQAIEWFIEARFRNKVTPEELGKVTGSLMKEMDKQGWKIENKF